jgi:hypothetical protein
VPNARLVLPETRHAGGSHQRIARDFDDVFEIVLVGSAHEAGKILLAGLG